MKSYTDIEQSKILSKILPLESADMFWYGDAVTKEGKPRIMNYIQIPELQSMYYSPCWSLSALLSVLPEYNLQRTDWGNKTEHKIVVTINEYNYASKNYDNPLDACVAMIEKLYELNLL